MRSVSERDVELVFKEIKKIIRTHTTEVFLCDDTVTYVQDCFKRKAEKILTSSESERAKR